MKNNDLKKWLRRVVCSASLVSVASLMSVTGCFCPTAGCPTGSTTGGTTGGTGGTGTSMKPGYPGGPCLDGMSGCYDSNAACAQWNGSAYTCECINLNDGTQDFGTRCTACNGSWDAQGCTCLNADPNCMI
jgi:hypothetical protein